MKNLLTIILFIPILAHSNNGYMSLKEANVEYFVKDGVQQDYIYTDRAFAKPTTIVVDGNNFIIEQKDKVVVKVGDYSLTIPGDLMIQELYKKK